MRIQTKMLVFVLIPSVAILAAIGFFIQYRTYKMARTDAHEIAKNYSEKAANEIKADLDLDLGYSRSLAQALYGYYKLDSIARDSLYYNILKNQVEHNPRYISVWMNLEYHATRPKYTKNFGRRSVAAFMKNNQSYLLTEHKNLTGDNPTSGYFLAKSTNAEVILDPYLYAFDGANEVLVTSLCVPIRRNGNFVGLAGVDILLDKFQNNIKKITPYPGTFSFLLSNNATLISHTNPSLSGMKLYELYPELEAEHRISQRIGRGAKFSLSWDFEGIEHLVFVTPINISGTNTPWALGIAIPASEIMVQARNAIFSSILVGLLGLMVLGVVIFYIARSITKPLKATTQVLQDLAHGDIDPSKMLSFHSGDELEDMATSVNSHIAGINRTESFAREIGKGNLNAEYQLLGPRDLLGISLIDMQRSLIHARDFEMNRKADEQKQNWETQGMALFGNILRQNSSSIKEFAYNIIYNLVNFTGANLGGIYIINDNDMDHPVLDMAACYAYDRRKYLEKTIETNEGLVGRCFRELKTIFMTQVPAEYIKISSGLGQDHPRCLILVPMKTNEEALGVLELASFQVFENHHIQFMEKVAESIATSIANVRINFRTSELLAKSQQQAEEMLAQEEEMRQNMEELQATQEEMDRKRHEQEKIQETLHLEVSLLNALMQNIPDFVYFKDMNSRFLRISKSMVALFNAASPDELLGKSDFDFHSPEHAQKAFLEEQDIIRSRHPLVDEIVHEQFDDGREQWVSTTKMPLIDGRGEVLGVWGISKIITNLKKTELEAQEKAAETMALSQKVNRLEKEFHAIANALDSNTLVAEFNPQGMFASINAPMQDALGFTLEEIKGKSHSELLGMKNESPTEYQGLWNDLRNGIIRQREFKGTLKGRKFLLHETYSPVRDSSGKLEKVILIASKG